MREVTLEANPETVTDGAARGVSARAGVNRLSFGVQSFRDDELRRLSRLHSADRARAALARGARRRLRQRQPRPDDVAAGAAASSSGSSRSTRRSRSAPEHLSLYMLEVYPNAPLKDDMARARWSQAPDDDAAAMYLTAMERLEAAGLRAVRDLERRAARPAIAPQPEILDRRRVARLRLRRAFDPRGVRWKNVSSTEEYVDRIGRGEPPAIDVRRADARRAAGRRAVHRPAAD